MIDEHKDSVCRIFLCYRESGSETAKNLKSFLKNVQDKDYGRVWYSDDENVGNFNLDIGAKIGQASIFILFLHKGFTDYFLAPDGKVNTEGYGEYGPCITVKEIIEIEKQRQRRDINVLTANINQYFFTEEDLDILKKVFEASGLLRDDTIDFYRNLNRNVYIRRQSDFEEFAKRLVKGLEEKNIIPQEKEKSSSKLGETVSIIDESSYREYFQALIKEAKYPIVKFFGYTGEVLSSDLLTYIARYSLNIELRILQRNFVIEEKDEKIHNAKLPEGIRPWSKSKAIKQMCYEKWEYSLKRTIKYYSHQPILKGTLFCNANGRAILGFINFQKWEEMPSSGGSVFKSVPSDMLLLNSQNNSRAEILLERVNSQFEYEWSHALSAEEMKNYSENGGIEQKKNKPKAMFIDFDRTLTYLYKDTDLLLELAQKMCEYYEEFTDVPADFYELDGYHAWHGLHRKVREEYDEDEAFDINNAAEKIVTKFETEVADRTPLFDGAIETLRKLNALGIDLVIISSNSSKVIKRVCEREGIIDMFKKIIGRPIPFNPDLIKPSPYSLEQGLRLTKAERSDVWFIGDDIVDIDSAKACKIIPVGVASGKYTKEALENRGAKYTLDSITDILSIIN